MTNWFRSCPSPSLSDRIQLLEAGDEQPPGQMLCIKDHREAPQACDSRRSEDRTDETALDGSGKGRAGSGYAFRRHTFVPLDDSLDALQIADPTSDPFNTTPISAPPWQCAPT